ncbi:MAG: macro domain-containing protein [Thermomicrobiales bacterium]|nr:macro domain-containing protein [Thermomicrobiales bacterium]
MPESHNAHEARFGRMRIVTTIGETVDQPVQAVIYPANSRGVMGTGAISAVRSSAGLDVEREAMSFAPIEPGTAIVTSSGKLSERGIEAIIHAVVTEKLGQRIDRHTMRRAISTALRLADEHRYHTLAMPLMGINADDSIEARTHMIQALIDETVAHTRRSTTRIEQLTIAARFEDDLPIVANLLAQMREHRWTGQE